MIKKEIIIINNLIKNLFSEEVTPFSVEDMKEISSNKTNEIPNLFVEEINSHEIDICNENKSHDKVLYLSNKCIYIFNLINILLNIFF